MRITDLLKMAGLTLGFTIMGCHSELPSHSSDKAPVIVQTASTPTPSWVFGPSAHLPSGFPPPGPVGEIIIKRYPACRQAVVDRDSAHHSSGSLFMPLFHHIQANHIAMSAPVVMTYRESASDKTVISSMAFVYPTPTTGNLQTQGAVHVVNIPAMSVVSIGVRGGYTKARFLKALGKLNLWVYEHRLEYVVTGQARYLGYNSPLVPSLFRFGEVQLPIQPLGHTKP